MSFNPGMKPLEMTQMAPGHWFVDFGTEIMAGLTLKVQGGKAGSLVNVKLSEELMCRGCVGPAASIRVAATTLPTFQKTMFVKTVF